MEKASDKLGQTVILLPVLAFLTFAIIPELPGPEILRISVGLLALAALLVSGPLGAYATRRRYQRDSSRWWLPFAVGTVSFVLAVFTIIAIIESRL